MKDFRELLDGAPPAEGRIERSVLPSGPPTPPPVRRAAQRLGEDGERPGRVAGLVGKGTARPAPLLGDLGRGAGAGPTDVDGWPAPAPVRPPGHRHRVVPFDPAWLPEGARPWVEDVSHRMQVPPDFAAVSAMVVVAASVGRRVTVRPKQNDDWTVVPNLWALIVGRPGQMKSPVLKQMAAPLAALHAEAQRAYEAALAAHGAAVDVVDARRSAAREAMKRALKDDPDADVGGLSAPVEGPAEPVRVEYLVRDATPEALVETARSNPMGFLHLRDEAAGLIARLENPAAGEERALYLTSWNGDGEHTQSRIGRGHVHAEAVCQSILGGIQPGKLRGLVGGAVAGGGGDDGMLQRFQLMVEPDVSTSFEVVDEPPDTVARDRYERLVRALVGLDPAARGATTDAAVEGRRPERPYLRFDAAAQGAFFEWLSGLELRLRGGALHPSMESHLAKYRSLVPSLALLVHLADGASGPVSASALGRALSWAGYLEAHAARVYASGSDPGDSGARTLGRRVLAGDLPDPFTVRDVYRKGWTGLSKQGPAQAAADVLIDHGWLRAVSVQKGSRRYEAYEVSPRLRGARVSALLPDR